MRWRKPTLRATLSTVVPWLVILGLVYIALFTEPGKLGKTIVPSPISAVDRFYGAAQVDGQVFWAVGNYGKIIKSTDGVGNWEIQSASSEENLQAIAAWNKNHAVVVGDHSTVLVTRDGGKTWDVPKSSHIYHKLIRVRILPDGRAWAVGAWGAILSSSDGGKTWKRMRSREDVTLHDIAGVGNKIWVVGEFGTILFSDDEGATWTKQESGTDGTLTSVHFRDETHGVAAGLDGDLFTTTDGGKSWSRKDLPGGHHFFAASWNGSHWLVAADGGAVAVAGPSEMDWQLEQLSPKNRSWHTSVVPTDKGWLLVGSSVGLYANGKWTNLSSVQQQGYSS